jgi:hypothetical protein
VNISTVARLLGLKVKTLYNWYKEYLSNYCSDIANKKWCSKKIESLDKKTGEIKEKPVYILKSEHLGSNMSIDDKCIGHEGFTILSNNDTGKIAMMIESTTAREVAEAIGKISREELQQIKTVSMDMSPTYALVFNNLVPCAEHIIDKFHGDTSKTLWIIEKKGVSLYP